MTRAVPLLVATTLLSAAACPPASDHELLSRSWRGWLARFVTADGRVVRPEHGGDTVSEGQAYTMLRAAWMGDQPAFDRVWAWTRTHLARSGRPVPNLLAWRWVPASEGGGAVADWEPATDADEDYAMALLVAAQAWRRPQAPGLPPYETEARAVLADLAAHATARDADGRLVFLPGLWAEPREQGAEMVLNPSYLSPAWYRVFAQWTGDRQWDDLASSSYVILDAVCGSGSPSPRVVPDWIRWRSPSSWEPRDETTISGWDAVRVAWRIGMDAAWFPAGEGRAWLERCVVPGIAAALQERGGPTVEHDLAGAPIGDPHPLAAAMAAFATGDDALRGRLVALVAAHAQPESEGRIFLLDRNQYYVNGLAWLPFALRAGRLRPPAPPQPLPRAPLAERHTRRQHFRTP